MFVMVVRDVKLNGSARAVAIQVIVYSTLDVNDQRDLNAHEIELPAEIVFDIPLNDRDGLLCVFWTEQRVVILR